MSRLKTVALVLGLFVFFILLQVVLGPGQAPSLERDHSTLNTNRWGMQGLYEVCQRLDLPTVRIGTRFQKGFVQPGEVLLILNAQVVPTVAEYEALWEAVYEGAQVIVAVCGEQGDTISCSGGLCPVGAHNQQMTTTLTLAYLGLVLKPSGRMGLIHLPPEARRGPAANVEELQMPSNYRLARVADSGRIEQLAGAVLEEDRPVPPLLEEAEYQVIAEDEDGIVAAGFRLGQGRVYVVSEVELFSNEQLGEADNAVLALNLITAQGRPSRVLFDEYHHGILLSTAPPADLNYRAFGAAMWLAFAALAIFTLGHLWRWGRPRGSQEPSRRSVLEYVGAFAALYREARAGGAVIRRVGEDFRRRLAERLHLPVRAGDQELIQAAAERGSEVGSLEALLQRWETLSEDDRVGEREVLEFVQQVSDLEEALD